MTDQPEIHADPTTHITVKQAIHQLMDMPPNATLMICAHAFPGQEGKGWIVRELQPVEGDEYVLIEGAGPTEAPSE